MDIYNVNTLYNVNYMTCSYSSSSLEIKPKTKLCSENFNSRHQQLSWVGQI